MVIKPIGAITRGHGLIAIMLGMVGWAAAESRADITGFNGLAGWTVNRTDNGPLPT
ncbi:MAG: hypothetical protein HBSAPP03_30290 [Phycisphaerae bacterium]|nr:MAG: hypothetical protein HBSAPP03_30290 [Phycisphaerae bacterium]